MSDSNSGVSRQEALENAITVFGDHGIIEEKTAENLLNGIERDGKFTEEEADQLVDSFESFLEDKFESDE